MTWKEIKLRTLQHMFSNETEDLTVDENNKEYLNAMPGVANEGLQMLCTVGRPIRKRAVIHFEAERETEELLDGELHLPCAQSAWVRIDMKAAWPDYRSLDVSEVYNIVDGRAVMAELPERMGDSIVQLPGEAAEWELWYNAYPIFLTAETADDAEMGLAPEAEALLPLYMASQLYKDDSMRQSVQWRNEFEDGLAKLRASYASDEPGGRVGTVRCVTGWWR